jgi:hypothetical protein
VNAKAGHSQDRPSYHGRIVEHGIVPDATSEARSETPPMNTIPTTDAGQLALPWHTASFASATGPALQKRQKPLARRGFPRFDQLRFQSGQATGRAPLREKFSVRVGKALAPVR